MCFFLAGSGSEFVPGSKVPNYVISLIVWIVYTGIWRFPLLLLPASHLPLLPPPGRHHATMTFKNIFYSVPYGTMQKKDFRLKIFQCFESESGLIFPPGSAKLDRGAQNGQELFLKNCSKGTKSILTINVVL